MSISTAGDGLSLLQIIILAIVQGVTEFLPISSSAHLILVPVLTGWQDQGLAIDVALHIGSLLAVMLYFRKDVKELTLGGLGALFGRRSPEGRLAWQLIAATVPVLLAGLLIRDEIGAGLRSPAVIAGTTIAFGVLLWVADRRAEGNSRTLTGISWAIVIFIGLFQAIALIPGVSRSGITMTAGLFAGLSRTDAARFSLLLSIPTTAAAGALGGLEIARSGDAQLAGDAILAGLLAFAAAYAAIAWLMNFLKAATFTPFVIYRLVLGFLLIGLILGGVVTAHTAT
ncbi:MAG: undecaprenyl-diphosphatase [Hyphomonas sp. 34-62-18]|nr:undecaprenyl-diphosphate phosphatase [Hyphomonas sp. 34-62-18]OZB17789.1 MAG: undecaprenyl-diphosphatase [Hyphomonas sp. 34-62-18]